MAKKTNFFNDFDDFLRTQGLLYLTYRARTVAGNGEKDAFSVISDNEWNP